MQWSAKQNIYLDLDVATKLEYNISQLQLPRTGTSFHIHTNAAPD